MRLSLFRLKEYLLYTLKYKPKNITLFNFQHNVQDAVGLHKGGCNSLAGEIDFQVDLKND